MHADSPCPVARSADLLGDRWALLVIRDAFDGITRFGDFQRSLGAARNILSDRLRLVEAASCSCSPPMDRPTRSTCSPPQAWNCSRCWSHFASGESAIASVQVKPIHS